MAIHSASSFLFMRKEGEAQTSEMTSNMTSMFGSMALSFAPMLVGSLQEGIERTFTKRMEKKLESSLESPIKKASKAFGSMDTESTSVFGKIKNKAKGFFSSLGSLSKKLSGVGNMTGSFDAMANSAEKVIPKVDMVSETIEKVKSKKIIEPTSIEETVKKVEPKSVQPKGKSITTDVEKPIRNTGKQVGSGFDSVTKILQSVWNGLKTVLTDIVKFVSSSMKELSSGIGTSIKNVLKGIGDGLSSFKGSALKGAAVMVILSGALWITSKAVQNFASVKWEDLAKAGVALTGLVGASLLLGSASVQMLLGAVAIAALGASLIPAAYALDMFSKIEWSSLAKAGVALIGLGVAGGIIGSFLPPSSSDIIKLYEPFMCEGAMPYISNSTFFKVVSPSQAWQCLYSKTVSSTH
jgi:hypothetical protein